MMNILRGIWTEEVMPCICEVRVNQYGISFKTEEIMERMLGEGPWLVIGYCFTMKRWPKEVSIEEIEFIEMSFWIQVHNLPTNLLTVNNAEIIGRRIGKLIKIDEQWIKESLVRGFLMIRVEIKIRKALIDRFWLPNGEGGRRWIRFKYEKLSDYYFTYRRLGHVLKNYGEDAKMVAIDPT
ncbi:hypothetical protein CRYUN_Cryun34aG0111700 [Craigia yunnanensis]